MASSSITETDSKMNVKVIDEYRIAPPPASSPPKTSLPLTLFDVFWTDFPPMKRLMFFQLHIESKQHFFETVLPNIKNSLSLALQHFYPFAGHLIKTPSTDFIKPAIIYSDGDSVAFAVAESNSDFEHLTSYGARDTKEYSLLIPSLVSKSEFFSPLMAIQVTSSLTPHVYVLVSVLGLLTTMWLQMERFSINSSSVGLPLASSDSMNKRTYRSSTDQSLRILMGSVCCT
ncbi:hypothetical protein Sjap_016627 [Stephania japonica]|uniref:Uncharacterized protein n=1 Tax=Stephania japonica TaxID=461633 RepID=A0AAP0ILX6_9MAGN